MYTNLTELKEYLKKRYDITNFSDEEIERAMYQAFDKVEMLNIRDSGREKGQEFHFPRANETEIPQEIKKAIFLESYKIFSLDKTAIKDIQNGILSKHIGDMSITYKDTNKTFLSEEAEKLLLKYVRKTW